MIFVAFTIHADGCANWVYSTGRWRSALNTHPTAHDETQYGVGVDCRSRTNDAATGAIVYLPPESEMARALGNSPRTVRDLVGGWLADGRLLLADPARKSRCYQLSAE